MKAVLYYPKNFVDGTRVPPFSCLYPAKALQQEGHEVALIDARFGEKTLDSKLSDADLFGVSAGMSLQYGTALAAMKKAKEYGCKVVLGGVFASLNRKFVLRNPHVDCVVRGEAEKIITKLIDAEHEGAPGVSYASNGNVIDNPSENGLVDLNRYLPLPWDLIDPKRYVHEYKGMKLYYHATSRGCPHRCEYCYQKSFWERRWRGIKPDAFFEEIDALSKIVDFDALYLFDDNFMVDRKRGYRMIDELYSRGIKWSCMSRANYLNKELVEDMKTKGCYKVCIGAESGSQRTLDLMKKDIQVNDIVNAANLLRESGLYSEFFFMIGYLGETLDNISKTVDLADYVEKTCGAETFIRVTLPFYGTSYYDQATESGFRRGDSLNAICGENWTSHSPRLPWFNPRENSKIKCIAALSEMRFARKKLISELPLWEKIFLSMLGPVMDYRWNHRFWELPLEFAPYQMISHYREKRALRKALDEVGMYAT